MFSLSRNSAHGAQDANYSLFLSGGLDSITFATQHPVVFHHEVVRCCADGATSIPCSKSRLENVLRTLLSYLQAVELLDDLFCALLLVSLVPFSSFL